MYVFLEARGVVVGSDFVEVWLWLLRSRFTSVLTSPGRGLPGDLEGPSRSGGGLAATSNNWWLREVSSES